MTKVQKYLLEQEWSMGNGQCPDCCGNPESWLGHPLFLTSEKLGHEKNCPLAEAMVSAGLKPLYQGKSKLKGEYEMYINEGGIFSTRPKTKEGCPKLKKINEGYRKGFDDILIEVLGAELSSENKETKIKRSKKNGK